MRCEPSLPLPDKEKNKDQQEEEERTGWRSVAGAAAGDDAFARSQLCFNAISPGFFRSNYIAKILLCGLWWGRKDQRGPL